MPSFLNALRKRFKLGSSENVSRKRKIDTALLNEDERAIQNEIENFKNRETVQNWFNLTVALRIFGDTIRGTVEKRMCTLYNTILVRNSQDNSKAFAELAFLFDTRRPRPKKVPRHYIQRVPSKSPAALAQCFVSMPIMKHDFDEGSIQSTQKAIQELSFSDFDASSLCNVMKNCEIFHNTEHTDTRWLSKDKDIDKVLGQIIYIRNCLMHSPTLQMNSATTKMCLNLMALALKNSVLIGDDNTSKSLANFDTLVDMYANVDSSNSTIPVRSTRSLATTQSKFIIASEKIRRSRSRSKLRS